MTLQDILKDALAVADIANKYGATKADRQDIVDAATKLKDLLSSGLPGGPFSDADLHAKAAAITAKIDAELAR